MAETQDTRPPFREQLQKQWDKGKFLCIGLDVDIDKLPRGFIGGFLSPEAMRDYRKGFYARQVIWDKFLMPIIKATSDIAGFYKPNIAFYEGNEQKQWALESTLRDLNHEYPEIPIIGDTKRADIGNTNKYYAEMFDRYGFDAMTTNPYFGGDTFPALQTNHTDRGLFVLCRTTNKGAEELQDMPISIEDAHKNHLLSDEEFEELWELRFPKINSIGGPRLKVYEMVAYLAARRWNENGQLGLVVGATHPEAFEPVRQLAPEMPFLIPGIGTQGGDLEKLSSLLRIKTIKEF